MVYRKSTAPRNDVDATSTIHANYFGELVGLTEARIYQLGKIGILPPVDGGRMPLGEAIRAWNIHMRKHKDSGKASKNSMDAERARLFKARADQAENDAAVQFGELIPIEQIEKPWLSAINNFKIRLLGVPSKIASRLVGVKSELKAQEIVYAEIESAFKELASTKFEFVPVRRPGGNDPSDREDLSIDGTSAEDDDFDVGGREALPKSRVKRRARQVAHIED